MHSNNQGVVHCHDIKNSREGKPEYTLTEDDRKRIAEQREAALQRRSKAIAQIIQNKRKQALARKAAFDEAAEQKKKHKANFDLTDDFAQADHSGDDPGIYEEPLPAEADYHAATEEPPAKKRRLTGKQKYQGIAAHTAELKNLVSSEWKKHGEASSRPSVTRTASGSTSVINEQRDPKTISSDAPPAANATKIHKSHHKMRIRDINFCKHCGYNSSRKPQKLKEPCHLKPKHNFAAQQRRRMLAGYHPNANLEFWPDGLSTLVRCHPTNLDGV